MTAGVRDGAKINIAETNAYREMQAAQQAQQAAAAQQQYAAAQQVRRTARLPSAVSGLAQVSVTPWTHLQDHARYTTQTHTMDVSSQAALQTARHIKPWLDCSMLLLTFASICLHVHNWVCKRVCAAMLQNRSSTLTCTYWWDARQQHSRRKGLSHTLQEEAAQASMRSQIGVVQTQVDSLAQQVTV